MPHVPAINRYTISSPDEADGPRTRLELNALHALGAILNKREWWTKWTAQDDVRSKWLEELDEAVVKANLTQVLAVWPSTTVDAHHSIFKPFVEAAKLTNAREKKRKIGELLKSVNYPISDEMDALGFGEGNTCVESEDEYEDSDEEEDEDEVAEGEEDSEDETVLDFDGNLVSMDVALEQAKKEHGRAAGDHDEDGDCQMDDDENDMSGEESVDEQLDADLCWHKLKNPFAQIGWYVKMLMMQETLSSIPPADWTEPRILEVVEGALVRRSSEVIARASSLILTVVQSEFFSPESLKMSFSGQMSDQGIKILHFHLEAARVLLANLHEEIETVLGIVVGRLALPTKPDELSSGPIIVPGSVPKTWICDELISPELKSKFASEIKLLEELPEEDKDWHPATNNQVLDLVHPSLYCGVVGQTPRLPQSAMKRMYGSVIEHLRATIFAPTKSKLPGPKTKSTKFQWLPCEVDVDEAEDGGNASILTYINNLHPETHARLYQSLEAIFTRFVPLFDNVLSTLDNEAVDRANRRLYEYSQATLPCPPALVPPGLFEASTPQFSLKGSRCQVIVKIAEIHLTPEKPNYAGGSWHIEGTDAERIIATGLYYFGSDNITESRLSFRVFVKQPEESSDDVGVGLTYGLENKNLLIQHMGSVTALEDRCVVFPNVYQHKVESFSLADPTKPGVRKVLAFFLVDPTNNAIASTAVVPPQQQDWIDRAREPQLKRLRLPDNVEQQLRDMSREGMSLEEAKTNRVKLMAERSPSHDEGDYDFVFSLCEH